MISLLLTSLNMLIIMTLVTNAAHILFITQFLTNNNTGHWHLLSGNLQPSAWSGTQVDAHARRL